LFIFDFLNLEIDELNHRNQDHRNRHELLQALKLELVGMDHGMVLELDCPVENHGVVHLVVED
jgi:hypothetical protein